MNPSLNTTDDFIFDSFFESGNLDCVIKKNKFEFDLFLRIDSNARGHLQWFFFKVKNQKQVGIITMHLVNICKSKTLYETGMPCYVFSRKKY